MDVVGTTIELERFLGNCATSVDVKINNGALTELFRLEEGRVYRIPYYQREIRWENKEVLELLDDIADSSRYFGSIMLSKVADGIYDVLDGQQRITVLYMILTFLKKRYSTAVNVFDFCKIENESFGGFVQYVGAECEVLNLDDQARESVLKSDMYRQIPRLRCIWNIIEKSEHFTTRIKVKKFIDKFQLCRVGLLINLGELKNIKSFLDVNVKGIKLDAEDIFKGYLFDLDDRVCIKEYWKEIKQLFFSINDNYNCYKNLISLFGQCFYCVLYKEERYEGIQFKSNDLVLKKRFKLEDGTHLNEGSHIIIAISDNGFMEEYLKCVTAVLKVIELIVNGGTNNEMYKALYCTDAKITDTEKKIIQNFLKKIFCDKYDMPKLLAVKYIIEVLLNPNVNKMDYKIIYAVYMTSVLFVVFDGKRHNDELCDIVKSDDWVRQLYGQIEKYLFSGDFGANKLRSLNKYVVKEDENETEDDKYRCKSLATVYNFFEVKWERGKIINIQIRKGQQDCLMNFLYDEVLYSVEHFIFNDKGKNTIKYSGGELIYTLPSSVKKFVPSLFNFIFIDKEINNKRLQSHCIRWKMEHLCVEEIKCLYSRLVYDCIQNSMMLRDYPETDNLDNVTVNTVLDRYYENVASEGYQELVNQILDGVKKRFRLT